MSIIAIVCLCLAQLLNSLDFGKIFGIILSVIALILSLIAAFSGLKNINFED